MAGLQLAPDTSIAISSSADQTITGGTAAPLTALLPGPSGLILVTAHPSNGAVIIRVSGSDVTASKGQPLAAGASYAFSVTNASQLHAIVESGSGKLCVSAV